MRRYFLCLVAPTALVFAAIFLLLVVGANVAVQGNYWESEGLRRKLALADREGPKIVVVAGSNAYFGINASTFAESTGRNAVNLAMQGAVPFEFYAALIEHHLSPGDIVLLPLEYAYYGDVHQTIQARVKTIEASLALSLMPSYFLKRPPAQSLELLRYLSFARLWEGVMERFEPGRNYRVGVFNEWGDNTADYGRPDTKAHLQNALREELSRGLTSFDRNSLRVRELERFASWARLHKVRIVAALPNTINAPPFHGSSLDALRRQIVEFWSSQRVPVLEAGATIPDSLVLDTPYHPTLAGARWRTALLVQEFCAVENICVATAKRQSGG
jgi:hypothetical protein